MWCSITMFVTAWRIEIICLTWVEEKEGNDGEARVGEREEEVEEDREVEDGKVKEGEQEDGEVEEGEEGGKGGRRAGSLE